MQIGGSDQFGNIVAGIEAVKYIARNHPDPDVRQKDDKTDLNTPYGFTVPLLTTASGAKFGKSAGNAIWLDPDMTSLFDLYGVSAVYRDYLDCCQLSQFQEANCMNSSSYEQPTQTSSATSSSSPSSP